MIASSTGKHRQQLGTPATGIGIVSTMLIIIELAESVDSLCTLPPFQMDNYVEDVTEMTGSRQAWCGFVDGMFQYSGIVMWWTRVRSGAPSWGMPRSLPTFPVFKAPSRA